MGRVECGGYIGHRQHVECMGYMWHRGIWGIYGIYGICEAQGTYGAWGTYGELAPRQPSLTPCPIGRCLLPRAGSQGVLCHPPGLREERHEVSELAVGTHEGQGAQVAEVPMCSTAPQQGACGGPVLQRFGVLTSSSQLRAADSTGGAGAAQPGLAARPACCQQRCHPLPLPLRHLQLPPGTPTPIAPYFRPPKASHCPTGHRVTLTWFGVAPNGHQLSLSHLEYQWGTPRGHRGTLTQFRVSAWDTP